MRRAGAQPCSTRATTSRLTVRSSALSSDIARGAGASQPWKETSRTATGRTHSAAAGKGGVRCPPAALLDQFEAVCALGLVGRQGMPVDDIFANRKHRLERHDQQLLIFRIQCCWACRFDIARGADNAGAGEFRSSRSENLSRSSVGAAVAVESAAGVAETSVVCAEVGVAVPAAASEQSTRTRAAIDVGRGMGTPY